VKILLDECTPRLIQRHLAGHQVSTVQEQGWHGIKNGELLRRAESHFEVLITTDQNLRHQQNLSGKKLSVIVLPSNQVPIVVRLLPRLLDALASVQPGVYVEIETPPA